MRFVLFLFFARGSREEKSVRSNDRRALLYVAGIVLRMGGNMRGVLVYLAFQRVFCAPPRRDGDLLYQLFTFVSFPTHLVPPHQNSSTSSLTPLVAPSPPLAPTPLDPPPPNNNAFRLFFSPEERTVLRGERSDPGRVRRRV